ncbi:MULTISPECIES: ABC transporter permease subunit [unclassified Leucobacter]|uniref:ABC transporter permease subunit n=1 Tax=unclassified Leucobacter TaxID=2621730 RepID=UPI00165E114D|nr:MULTISPECIES: ABC transporter permease subunit [unclassified Leucobacter]MBC9927015.1 ABC transporter permease subunit [Leucobacter sp. cx-169]
MSVSTQAVPALRNAQRRNALSGSSRAAIISTLSRIITIFAVIFMLGILPLLSGRDIAASVYRSRYSEGAIDPEALEAIRLELGLNGGPVGAFFSWFGNAVQGDFGVSWTTRQPVMPEMISALGVSLTLMLASLVVAVVLGALLTIPTFVRGLAGRSDRTGGGIAAAFTALPEFLLASVLLVVFAVWLGWFPPFGWRGISYVVLPALSMGLPTGGFLGRLLSDALANTFSERWVATWQVAGFSKTRIIFAVIRRTLPAVTAPMSLILVGITAGAVVIEQVYAIPGIGRATLAAVQSQDLPMLQAGVILLMLLAVLLGLGATLLRRVLLGPALRSNSLPAAVPKTPSSKWALVLPAVMLVLLIVIVVAGLPRDPYALDYTRLQPPSWELPLGADASGRDVLARISHGALSTMGVGVLVAGICLVLGLIVGMFPNAGAGPIEITNAAPPIIAGLIVAAVLGPSSFGAAIAVAAVSWAPLAAHTAALVSEVKAQPHVKIAPVLGVGKTRMMLRYVLPSVIGPVFRHACLRLPGIALALAALGFLGLGPQPPQSDWGLVLAEGMPYVERAPLVVLVPAGALMLLSIFAVSLSSLSFDFRRGRNKFGAGIDAAGNGFTPGGSTLPVLATAPIQVEPAPTPKHSR